MTESVERLQSIQARIKMAASMANSAAESIDLVAVSKTYSPDHIMPLLDAGHRVFGENRIQEAQLKWVDLKEKFHGIELHLIGPLQSNKAKEAVALFDVIETIDRDKIAQALAAEMMRQNRSPVLYVQINTGEEPQKSGILPGEADEFLDRCRFKFGLKISGLMCIPPVGQAAGPHFALLAKIAQQNNITLLSMGMSSDFETAIAFGATHVRVGSAIFGERVKA